MKDLIIIALVLCALTGVVDTAQATTGAGVATTNLQVVGGAAGPLDEAFKPLFAVIDFLSNKLAVVLAVFGIIVIALALIFKQGEMTELVKGLVGVVVVAVVVSMILWVKMIPPPKSNPVLFP